MASVIKLDHIYRMTDDTGMLQHSRYSIPDRKYGYTADDNSRALIMALALSDITASYDAVISRSQIMLAETYLGFIQYAQQPNGWWRNFMNYSRRFVDTDISEDCYGRCMLACSYASGKSIFGISDAAFEMFQNGLNYINKIVSPRGMAYTALALIKHLEYSQWTEYMSGHIMRLADALYRLYEQNARTKWHWFESYLTYCNGILPQAAIALGDVLNRKELLGAGIDSLSFLIDKLMTAGWLDIVGNKGWWPMNGKKAVYDQQCVDAASTLWACVEAYRATGRLEFKQAGQLCWEWFWGRNRSGMALYDPENGGCYDGLTYQGINKNQGAESLISFFLSYIGALRLELDDLPIITATDKYIIK